MEYIQTILFQIPASRIEEASQAGNLLSELDEHRRFLQQQTGFVDLRITRSINDEGNVLVVVETRWSDDGSLVRYETNEPNAQAIVNKHSSLLVPDTLQVLDMEALRTESSWRPAEQTKAAAARVTLPIVIPLGVLAFALLVIYGLSRVYLEIQGDGATILAATLAIGVLLVSFYLANNPRVPGWQIGGIVVVAAAVLAGGTIWAVVNEDEAEGEGDHVTEPTPAPGDDDDDDGGPGPGPTEMVITLGDNYIEYEGERAPTITVAAGEDVEFEVDNAGAAIHNIQVDGPDGEYAEDFCAAGGAATACSDPDRLAGGSQGTLSFNLDAGTYLFRCDYHATEMTGEFVVE